MKLNKLNIWFLFFPIMLLAQQEFHVFPVDHKDTPGRAIGDGSLQNPWDLQTALNLKPDILQSRE